MKKEKGFLSIFKNEKPILGMLHLKGSNDEDVFERFKRELNIYVKGGVDAIIVENYFGRYNNLEKALAYVEQAKLDRSIMHPLFSLSLLWDMSDQEMKKR